jgi:hypothetical protein
VPVQRGATEEITLDGSRYRLVPGSYKTDELEALATQIRSGLLSPADRANEFIATAKSWHLGFGLGEIRDVSDLDRYHYAKNVDARVRGQLVLGPLTTATTWTDGGTSAESKVQFIEFNGSWFAIGARYCHIWVPGTTSWTVDKDFGATSAAQKNAATVFANTLVVGVGNTDDYWSRTTGGVWSQPAAGIKAQMLALVGNTLWRMFSANQLSSSTNGTTWVTAVSIGNSNQTATLLSDYNGNPHVGKPEGLFEYDGTTVRNRLVEIAYRQNSENCRGGKPARGKMYLPIGPALWQYTADAVQTEGKPTRSAEVLAPSITKASNNEVRGKIKDLWPDVDFLWGVLQAQSGTYYLVSYDYNPTPGQGWHQVVATGTTAVTSVGRFQDTTGNPRMWYSEGTSAPKYFLLPLDAINPYADSAYLYASSGDIYLPVEGDTFDDVSKAQLSYKFEVDNVTTARYVDLSYSLDGGADTSLTRITTTGLSTVFFPSSTVGRRIQLHLHLVTDSSAQTPRVLPYSRHYQLRFERKKKWSFQIDATRLSGPNVPKDELRQLQAVETSRDSIAPVTFVDMDNRTWTVFVTKIGNVAETIDAQNKVWAIPVELLEWRSGGGVFSYNSETTVYDARAIWSSGSDQYTAAYS